MEIADPLEGVLNEVLDDFVAARSVEIDGLSPGRTVPVGEIRPKIGQVVSFRPQMVVDDVQYHRHSALVAGINQSHQASWSAIGALGGKRICAVVSPIAPTRELGHWHQLNCCDSEILQSIKMRDNGFKGSCW